MRYAGAMPDLPRADDRPLLSIAELKALRRKFKGPPKPRTEPVKKFQRLRPAPKAKPRWR